MKDNAIPPPSLKFLLPILLNTIKPDTTVAHRNKYTSTKRKLSCLRTRRGGRCVQENLWYSPPAGMMSRLAPVTFKMTSKVFIEETDKNFDFITGILFRFLGFGDFRVSIVREN